MCVCAVAIKNQITVVFSDVKLSASVQFYVRVDVFEGVGSFRAVNFYPNEDWEETCFFSLLFFFVSLSLVRLFATTSTSTKISEEKEKEKRKRCFTLRRVVDICLR